MSKTVATYVQGNILYLHPDQPLLEALGMLRQNRARAAMVRERDAVIGMFTEEAALDALGACPVDKSSGLKLRDVLLPLATPLPPETLFLDAVQFLTEQKLWHVPIARDGQLVGIFSLRDVLFHEDFLSRNRTRPAACAVATADYTEPIRQLAGNIAHQIKNPLGVIIQGINFLNVALPEPTADIKEVLEMIRKNVVRTDDIVRELSEFSKKKECEFVSSDLNEIVEQALRNIEPAWRNLSIQVTRDFQPQLPRVSANPTMLTQALVHVLRNAGQATGGAGTVVVKTCVLKLDQCAGKIGRRKDDLFFVGEEVLAIEVADAGPGMSPEVVARAFEPFFTTYGPREHAGLGLTIVKHIMGLHRGAVELKSREGAGTTVRFLLRQAK